LIMMRALNYAWRGAHRSRNEVWTPILGAIAFWLISVVIGSQLTLPKWVADNVVLSAIALVPICVVTAELMVFLLRLGYWPIQRAVEPQGGLRLALRKALGI